MSTRWSRVLPWRRERPVPYTPREPAAVADWSDIAVTGEDRKALGEAFRRLRDSSRAKGAAILGEDGSPICTCTIDNRCAWCSESDSATLARIQAVIDECRNTAPRWFLDRLDKAINPPPPIKCARCRDTGRVPNWQDWNHEHGEPRPKPCPDCQTGEG